MIAIGKIRDNQIIGEYVGGVELADTSKYSKHRHNDVMTLLNVDHASQRRCIMFRSLFFEYV